MNENIPGLYSCPFCGGPAYKHEVVDHYPADGESPAGKWTAWFNIGCNMCGVEVGDEYEEAAVAAWNRRAGVQEVPATKDDFPYDRTFHAIAAAVKIEGAGIGISNMIDADGVDLPDGAQR